MQALQVQVGAAVGALLGLLLLVSACAAAPERSSAVAAAFQRAHPCPVTGRAKGPCPGWVRDHKVPLCAGGTDHPSNMQWQTVAAAKAKDRGEWRECRVLRSRRSGLESG